MILSTWNILFSLTFLALFAAVAVLAATLRLPRRWWLLASLLAALVVVGMLLEGWPRTILVDLAAFAGAALVFETGTPQAQRAGRSYLALLTAAVAFMVAGLALGGMRPDAPAGVLAKAIPALLLVGFALKLALVPFYFWLPAVAENARPLTTVLIISLVDMSAFVELCELRAATPWVFDSIYPFWLGLALLSMFVGAFLALAQRDLKRMLAFSTIDDLGYLLLGLLGSGVGLQGAFLGAISHAAMKVLLFGAVAVVEHRLGRRVTLDERGLAARFPVCAAAFIIGALGMIGVPPTLGFVGRWRLYLSGAQQSGAWLVLAMMVATGLALLYYARAIHRVWLGQPGDGQQTAGEPAMARLALVVLSVLVIGSGIYPGLWTALLP